MKRFLLAIVMVLAAGSAAQAESWMFQNSYYSHDPVTHVRIGRQYSRGPVYTQPQGQYYNSGFRYNRSSIQIKGQVFDTTNRFEGWFQVGSQY